MFVRTRFQEAAATFSPDGKWLAFVSDETGAPEVYVAPISTSSEKQRVSMLGGFAPRWRRDGKELFYLEPRNRFMRVLITIGNRLKVGVPTELFHMASQVVYTRRPRFTAYDVSADGQRCLFNTVAADASSAPITVVLNWPSALKRH